MEKLKGNNILLRALEPEDLEFVYHLENNMAFWHLSGTQIPFSKYTIAEYISNAYRDIYDVKQLRLVIEAGGKTVGLLDMFDFDPQNRRAGVGIIIEKEEDKRKGYALESLSLLKEYSFQVLNLHQLYANIAADNKKSIFLFEKAGFEKVGVKKDWNFYNGKYQNELLYQIINQNVY